MARTSRSENLLSNDNLHLWRALAYPSAGLSHCSFTLPRRCFRLISCKTIATHAVSVNDREILKVKIRLVIKPNAAMNMHPLSFWSLFGLKSGGSLVEALRERVR